MAVKSIEERRAALEAEMAALAAEDARTEADRQPVTLDQQSVGRLSRMDAMQVQAMASAQSRHRAARKAQIRAALRLMDEGEYGWCQRCGDGIDSRRLDIDAAVQVCVDCARGSS